MGARKLEREQEKNFPPPSNSGNPILCATLRGQRVGKKTWITLATRVHVSYLPKICLWLWKGRGAVGKERTRCHVISCPKFQINFFNVEAWKIWFLAIHVKMADKLKFLEKNRRETTGSLNRRFQIAFKIAVESHANEEKLLRKHCWVSLNASPFLNPRNNEKCFWIFFRNALFPQQMFLAGANGETLLRKHFTQCFCNNVSSLVAGKNT